MRLVQFSKPKNAFYIFTFTLGTVMPLMMFGARNEDESMIQISQKDAETMERALEYVLHRAPRDDAPELGDAEFPVLDLDLEDIRRALCVIRGQLRKVCDKLEDIQVDLSMHDELLEDCCSIIEDIDDKIGNPYDTYVPFDGKYANYTNYTVIQWLKAIYCMCADTGETP